MGRIAEKTRRLKRRHLRVRRRVRGTAVRPRVSVRRGLKNMYVQIVDDQQQRTLVGMSTLSPEIKSQRKYGGNVAAAALLGEKLAEKAKGRGISKVVFDRGGYKYHGRVKALAESLRKAGLEF